jgi:hypothetical protein
MTEWGEKMVPNVIRIDSEGVSRDAATLTAFACEYGGHQRNLCKECSDSHWVTPKLIYGALLLQQTVLFTDICPKDSNEFVKREK